MLLKLSKTGWRWTLIIGSIVVLAAITLVPSPTTSVGAYLYEIVRGCPGSQPHLQGREEFLVIGHRGAAAYAVENTIASMDTAMALGANALEIDLCITADSVIVLWHDWDPDGLIARVREKGAEPAVLCAPVFPPEDSRFFRPIHQLSLGEFRANFGYRLKDSTEARMQAHIPTLEEFLAWSAKQPELMAVFLDIKVPESDSALAQPMIRRVEQILQRYGPDYKIVYLTAVTKIYDLIDPLLPQGNLSYDVEPPPGIVLQPCDLSSARTALENGNHYSSIIVPFTSTFAPWTTARRIIQCDLKLRGESRGGDSKRIEYVIASTLNDESQINCLLALGIDGIICDYPDRLRRLAGAVIATTKHRR